MIAFDNALQVFPFRVYLHPFKINKYIRATGAFQFFESNSWLMHILNVPLKIFLAAKISAAIREEIAFNCNRFVVDFHVSSEIIAWEKFAAVDALQFVGLVSFMTFFDMLQQIILGFKVKTALVAIFALKHFALMFLSHVAP
jgi:hypothetical protein